MTSLLEMIRALQEHYGDRYFAELSKLRLNEEGNIVKRERDCIEELYDKLMKEKKQ